MSKAKLKKELELMSREQLIDIILNVYSARKEAKDYFEFFLNPDSDALLEKYRELVKKEVIRAKRGNRSKFRISVIKRLIKDFQSLDPGPEYVLRLLSYSFSLVMLYSLVLYYSNIQDKGALYLAKEILDYGDAHQLYDTAVRHVNNVLENERGSAAYLRKMIARELGHTD